MIKDFESYLIAEKNFTKASVSSYISDMNNFMDFLGSTDLVNVSTSTVRSFVAHLTKLGRKRGSINRAVCSLKAFYLYLRDVEKVISESPAESIKTSRVGGSLPKYISEGDVASALRAASANTKDRLVMELLYGSGGRVSEVVSLRVEDIDFEDGFINILGKGRKERNNPIHSSCISLIVEYMEEQDIKEGFLFPHRTDSSKHMTREAAGKIVKRVAVAAGLDASKVSPHVFRHSFATHMLENGCDMAQVQELLGHEDIATTRIYARITKTSKRSNFDKFHPLALQVL